MLTKVNKNEDSFTVVFRKYFRSLCLFAERFLSDQVEAEDVVEELFTRLWQHEISFRDEEHLKAYLYRATYNACSNIKKSTRNRWRRQRSFLDETLPFEEDYLAGIITSEVIGELYQAIRSLPPQCARVIELSFVQGKKNAEIAEAMHLSLQTVKNYKKRGIDLLKESLSGKMWLWLLFYLQ